MGIDGATLGACKKYVKQNMNANFVSMVEKSRDNVAKQ